MHICKTCSVLVYLVVNSFRSPAALPEVAAFLHRMLELVVGLQHHFPFVVAWEI